jgi:nicotinamidase-related amidase
MGDALIVVDVVTTFEHDDAAALLASFRSHLEALESVLRAARARAVPVIYVNDSHGQWDSGLAEAIHRATSAVPGGDLVARVAPRAGEHYLRKPRYSAFDHTALELILRDLDVDRLLLVGAATEMCIVQTAIDARELGFKVTILASACASVDSDDADLALAYARRVVGVRVDEHAFRFGEGGDEWPFSVDKED